MGDAAESVSESRVKTAYKKRFSISTHRRLHKNTVRKVRRQRSKFRYYKSLKEHRYNRRTADLCSAVEVVDISGMEWAPSCSSSDLPVEVAEWQKQDQIAYWKSRAISLELENRMLHEHLRNVYAQTIQDWRQSTIHPETNTEEEEEGEDEQEQQAKHAPRSRKKSNLSNTNRPVSPKEPCGKNRLEEMKKIYGDKAQKIMGMETALQLNYEKQIEVLKPSHWPSMPLRLEFE
ncbi:hypothetical protein NQ315_007588 [Exocentrus adspersus]|uniref:Uncharacterized protein n=1 Tax=Exocentrus adspersus TaxID=1586481 RepID=A0AAV8W800_9CUCU|nr:hypothetical protein NQ315_007588 [Exocentrus adspersus]